MDRMYSSVEMVMATQIAYLDIRDSADIGKNMDVFYESFCQKNSDGTWQLKAEFAGDKYMQAQFGVRENIQRIAAENPSIGDKWRSWKVVDSCDDNNNTGFYGCLIDAGEGNAIIGCRGSEGFDVNQIINDWGYADAGLLDSILTPQQEKAQQYMERLYYQYGDQYATFSLTGHSLGGNLAQHMTIHAPAAMRNKIVQCDSFDGPGFSSEYIKRNGTAIEKVNDRMNHYQWSLVGTLLNPLPGVTPVIIKAHNEDYKESLWSEVGRHDPHNIEFDANGEVQRGDESTLSTIMAPYSRFIDHLGDLSLRSWGDLAEFAMALGEAAPIGLPVLFPLFLRFAVGVKLIAIAVSVFEGVRNNVRNLVGNLYYNFIAPQVSGNYEVDTIRLGSVKEELDHVYQQLDAITDDIASIRRNWPYNSGTGAYYKSLLFTEKCALESDASRLRSMIKVIEQAIQTYIDTDQNVERMFY